MKKIFSVLKDNIALNAINKNKGELIINYVREGLVLAKK